MITDFAGRMPACRKDLKEVLDLACYAEGTVLALAAPWTTARSPSTRSFPRAPPGPPSCVRDRSSPSWTLGEINPATACCTTPATHPSGTACRTRSPAAATSTCGPARCCAPARATPWPPSSPTRSPTTTPSAGRAACESNALRYGHHTKPSTPASRTSCSPRPPSGRGKRDMVSNINWFMNVPVEADGTLGIVDGISAPGPARRPTRGDGRPRPRLQLPADQQPLQRLQPDAAAHDRDATASGVRAQ